ncbi:MAG: hypothetical protein PXY39_06010 [archaeon]|nr:hypothetical protein [archaeon]
MFWTQCRDGSPIHASSAEDEDGSHSDVTKIIQKLAKEDTASLKLRRSNQQRITRRFAEETEFLGFRIADLSTDLGAI